MLDETIVLRCLTKDILKFQSKEQDDIFKIYFCTNSFSAKMEKCRLCKVDITMEDIKKRRARKKTVPKNISSIIELYQVDVRLDSDKVPNYVCSPCNIHLQRMEKPANLQSLPK